jgi:8-amino-7-oxononanoate synthase
MAFLGLNLDTPKHSIVTRQIKLLKRLNLYPFLKVIEDSTGPVVRVQGKDVIMIGANNYLGLTHDPRVKRAAKEAIDRFGTGCTGSRMANGNMDIHLRLEQKLREFLGKEDCLMYSTGYMANMGAVASMEHVLKDMTILSDDENHASIITGCQLSNARKMVYEHGNIQDLEKKMGLLKGQNKFVVTDGVFSMSGEVAKLGDICALKDEKTVIYVDDAHGLGVLGKQGRGTCDHLGVADRVELIFGTFSKSFASIGGFVAGSKSIVDYLRHKSRSFIFSASLPPSAVATAEKALDIFSSEPEHLENLWKNSNYMRKGFKELGLNTMNSSTPIIPIFVGSEYLTLLLCSKLFEHGIYVSPVIYPGVPLGKAMVRTSYMATHTKQHLDFVLDKFDYFFNKNKLTNPIFYQHRWNEAKDFAKAKLLFSKDDELELQQALVASSQRFHELSV